MCRCELVGALACMVSLGFSVIAMAFHRDWKLSPLVFLGLVHSGVSLPLEL